jgi:hypothetical protein
MTYPRAHLVDPDGGYYHVGSRCVRRAWLCGTDSTTGHNFDHRRQWLEDRILELGEIFAVDLCGYAVLSSHYHIVLRTDPHRVDDWSDEEVADKWIQVSPRKPSHPDAAARAKIRRAAMLEDKERLLILRERLGSLSWFMGFINEPLARLANKEDRCKGRFWESRFSSQRLLDENAILAGMVYVDLNPVRAGMTDDVAKGEHTSLAKRTKESCQEALVEPFNNGSGPLPFDFSLADYTCLAQWTATAQQSTRPVSLSKATFSVTKEYWLGSYLPKPGRWQRAIGSVQSLKDYAKEIGQRWIRTRSQPLQV